jgi:hypothetical protein
LANQYDLEADKTKIKTNLITVGMKLRACFYKFKAKYLCHFASTGGQRIWRAAESVKKGL